MRIIGVAVRIIVTGPDYAGGSKDNPTRQYTEQLMRTKRILVIDDEASLRDQLRKRLHRDGYDVVTAASGQLGLAHARDAGPDLIVLDVSMPGLNGFEVCQRLKAEPATSAIPIVFLTGSDSPRNREFAFHVGAAEFLSKSSQMNALSIYVEAALRRARPAPPPEGRVTAFFGLGEGTDPAAFALSNSEAVALHTDWPVVVMDLEWPHGRLTTTTGLRAGIELAALVENGPKLPADLRGLAQPYQGNLRIIPSPGRALSRRAVPDRLRLTALVSELAGLGHYVVLCAGAVLNETAVVAMSLADTVGVVTTDTETGRSDFAALQVMLKEQGIDPGALVPVSAGARDKRGAGESWSGRLSVPDTLLERAGQLRPAAVTD